MPSLVKQLFDAPAIFADIENGQHRISCRNSEMFVQEFDLETPPRVNATVGEGLVADVVVEDGRVSEVKVREGGDGYTGSTAVTMVGGAAKSYKVGDLNAAINDSVTALVLAAAPDVEPEAGDILLINDERLAVTAYTSGTRSVTVTRASGGTTAAAHAQGDDIYLHRTATLTRVRDGDVIESISVSDGGYGYDLPDPTGDDAQLLMPGKSLVFRKRASENIYVWRKDYTVSASNLFATAFRTDA